MATITIQVNDKTKVGQSLINIATELASKYKSISIIDKEKSPYNPNFVKMVKEESKSKNKHIINNVEEFWDSL